MHLLNEKDEPIANSDTTEIYIWAMHWYASQQAVYLKSLFGKHERKISMIVCEIIIWNIIWIRLKVSQLECNQNNIAYNKNVRNIY